MASTELLGRANTGQITGAAEVIETLEELCGLLLVKRVNNERKFRYIIDLVTAGHDKRSAGSGSEGRSNSVSLLVGVHLAVPLSPELERSEHAAFAAHVSEGTLA